MGHFLRGILSELYIRIRENGLKLLFGGHFTPAKLGNMLSSITDQGLSC